MVDVVPNAGVIALGKQGENQAVRVTLPNIRAGSGSILLLHQRSDDQKPYPVPVVEADGGIIWTVSSTDTAYTGRGQAELQWLGADGAVIKSVTYQTNVLRALTTPGAVPDEPLKPYTQAVAKDAQAAKNAAANATEAARSAEASSGQAGLSAATATEAAKNAEAIVGQAGQSAQSAQAAALAAAQNAAAAEAAEEAAKQAQTWAEAAKAAAEEAAQEAKTAQTGAVEAKTGAETAQAKAEEAAQEAQKAAETAVRYTEQNLTDPQQEQARSNINAADKARQNVLVGTETGNPIAVDDAFAAPLCGLTIYGKSTQDGTPSPDSPVPIVSAGDGGSVVVTLSDGNGKTQTLTLPTPNGLPGIPVPSGGDYTDPTSQQWVCDEVDLERGVRVQRVNRLKLDGLSWRYQLTLTNKNDSFGSSVPASQNGTLRGYSLCQYAVFDGIAYDIEMKESCRCYVWGKSVALQFKTGSGVNSVDAFSAWLKARPDASISYCLATPIETPLTLAEIAAYKAITAYAPDTVVQASDGAGVKLDYQRDVNIAIKKLEDAIASMTAT